MESQPWAFEETAPKGGKYEKQRKAQPSGRWAQNGL